MLSYQYRDSHFKDKTVSPTVLSLTCGISIPGKGGLYIETGPWSHYSSTLLVYLEGTTSLRLLQMHQLPSWFDCSDYCVSWSNTRNTLVALQPFDKLHSVHDRNWLVGRQAIGFRAIISYILQHRRLTTCHRHTPTQTYSIDHAFCLFVCNAIKNQ